jgi:hypothetical protein
LAPAITARARAFLRAPRLFPVALCALTVAAPAPRCDAMSEERWDSPAKIAELRAAGEAGGLARIFRSDEDCLKRFLRARRGDTAKALQMLLEHQAWRRSETPWWPAKACPLPSIAEDWKAGKAYIHGEDKTGSTLAFVQAALHDKNEDRAQLKRFIAFLNDEAVARLDASAVEPKPSQMTIIVSFTGFGYSAGFDVGAGMLIIQTLSNHYPERAWAGAARRVWPRSDSTLSVSLSLSLVLQA